MSGFKAFWDWLNSLGLEPGSKTEGGDKPSPGQRPQTKIVPGSVAVARLLRTYRKNNWPVRPAGLINIAYVEGRNKDFSFNGDRPDAFDDLRIVWRLNSEGMAEIVGGPWWATTEPGAFWTHNRMNPAGAFHIAAGYQRAWTRGVYHAQPALRQVMPLHGTRDDEETDTRHPGEEVFGVFGVHHHGTPVRDRDHMGHSSAGCLVGFEGHDEFMALIDADPEEKAAVGRTMWGAAIIPPYLLEG